MRIRIETPKDYAETYHVVKRAFETAEHADGDEQDLVNALRKGTAFLPELSLVAEENDRIIGHILFTEAFVGSTAVLALSPLSVLPAFQQQGVGTALIEEGHRIARSLGYPYAVVLGSETYYPRTGYRPADHFGIFPPFEVSPENFMAIKLLENAPVLNGTMTYAKEFHIG